MKKSKGDEGNEEAKLFCENKLKRKNEEGRIEVTYVITELWENNA